MAGNKSYIRPGRLCTRVFDVWSNRAPWVNKEEEVEKRKEEKIKKVKKRSEVKRSEEKRREEKRREENANIK